MAAIDITTLAAVKQRAEIPSGNSNEDTEISDAITAFSRYVLTRTGYASFSQTQAMSETRDGNGNYIMYAALSPILVPTAAAPTIPMPQVIVNGYSVPFAGSGSWPGSGFWIGDDQKTFRIRDTFSTVGASMFAGYGFRSVALRMTGQRGFSVGSGNVQLIYTGGYSAVPEDLEYAVRCIVAINYKRKAWQDVASKTVGVGGQSFTTRYRDWAFPTEYDEIIDYYTRKSIIT